LSGTCYLSGRYDLTVSCADTYLNRTGFVGICETRSSSFQRSLQARVYPDRDTVEIIGAGYANSYPVISKTATGFVAHVDYPANQFNPYACGDALGFGADESADITMSFDCFGHMTFASTCTSDIGADGCYPNYIETGSGAGTRVVTCPEGSAINDDDTCEPT
jgi:hypothetical protein